MPVLEISGCRIRRRRRRVARCDELAAITGRAVRNRDVSSLTIVTIVRSTRPDACQWTESSATCQTASNLFASSRSSATTTIAAVISAVRVDCPIPCTTILRMCTRKSSGSRRNLEWTNASTKTLSGKRNKSQLYSKMRIEANFVDDLTDEGRTSSEKKPITMSRELTGPTYCVVVYFTMNQDCSANSSDPSKSN